MYLIYNFKLQFAVNISSSEFRRRTHDLYIRYPVVLVIFNVLHSRTPFTDTRCIFSDNESLLLVSRASQVNSFHHLGSCSTFWCTNLKNAVYHPKLRSTCAPSNAGSLKQNISVRLITQRLTHFHTRVPRTPGIFRLCKIRYNHF